MTRLKEAGIDKTLPYRIWNMDETTVGTYKVALKGAIPADVSDPKVRYTHHLHVKLVFAGNAAGTVMMPPGLVVRGTALIPEEAEAARVAGLEYFVSPAGSLNREIFTDWVKNVFLKYKVRSEPGEKDIFILDNDSSHHSFAASDLLEAEGVNAVYLPPGTTDFLQPFDIAYFHPWKAAFRRALSVWQAKHATTTLDPTNLVKVIKECTDSLNAPHLLREGFAMAGLVPFDPAAMQHPLPDADARLVANPHTLTDDDMAQIAKDVLGDEDEAEPKQRRKRGRPPKWSYVLERGGHVSAATIATAKARRDEHEERERAKAERKGRRGRPPGSKSQAPSKRRRKKSGARRRSGLLY